MKITLEQKRVHISEYADNFKPFKKESLNGICMLYLDLVFFY